MDGLELSSPRRTILPSFVIANAANTALITAASLSFNITFGIGFTPFGDLSAHNQSLEAEHSAEKCKGVPELVASRNTNEGANNN
jgi:hypothetical protein